MVGAEQSCPHTTLLDGEGHPFDKKRVGDECLDLEAGDCGWGEAQVFFEAKAVAKHSRHYLVGRLHCYEGPSHWS